MRIVIFVLMLIVSIKGISQGVFNENIQKALTKLSNKKANFVVTNPVRFTDSSGKVISFKRIVELEDGYMRRISKRYGKSLIPYLVKMFDDSKRDWAANLLLYAVTESSAVVLRYYSVDKIEEWRQVQKQSDKEKWENYLRSMQ